MDAHDHQQDRPVGDDVADSAAATSAAADAHATEVGVAVAKQTLWRRFLTAQVSLPMLCAVALAGPCLAALLAALNEPGQTWVYYLLAAAGNGFAGPLIMVAMLTIATGRNEKRLAASGALLLSVFAARTRTYLDKGVPDPVRVAAIDVANSMAGRSPALLTGQWTTDAVVWHQSLAPSDGFPPLPRSVTKIAKRVPQLDQPQD